MLYSADRGGTAGFGVGVSFWTYAATQFQAVAHYLWLSVWPHPLIVDYGVRWVASVGEVAPYAAVVAVLVAATLVALVRRPALGFLGAWFFAILAPTSLVPGTRQTLAEHRMYLALAPVLVVLVLALAAWLGRRGRFVLAAAAVGLGWLTIQRNTVYHSDAAIWRDTVAKRPGNVAARNNYGNILSQTGRPGEALAQYEEAMRLKPGDADAHLQRRQCPDAARPPAGSDRAIRAGAAGQPQHAGCADRARRSRWRTPGGATRRSRTTSWRCASTRTTPTPTTTWAWRWPGRDGCRRRSRITNRR